MLPKISILTSLTYLLLENGREINFNDLNNICLGGFYRCAHDFEGY